MKFYPTGTAVWVEWEVAAREDVWWDTSQLKEWATSGDWIIQNVGWITYQDEQCIVVSAQRALRHKPERYAQNVRIPLPMIRRMHLLEATDERGTIDES